MGIPPHKLKEIEKGADPLVESVDYFLKGNVEGVPLSWGSIVTALKSDHVGEPALAKHLQNVYTQQGHEPQQGAAKGRQWRPLSSLDVMCCQEDVDHPKPMDMQSQHSVWFGEVSC